ncbi:MarR family winged helix-turn-helix transcriptional regulator [Acidisoma sp. 7E03]
MDQLLGYQLRRASFAMLSDLSAGIGKLDLRITEMSVLMVIQANPDITQSDIGRVLGIQRANMVPLVTQLERRALISRGETRGRAQSLRLTLEGEDLVQRCRAAIAAHEARFIKLFSPKERQDLLRCLPRIWQDDGQPVDESEL